MQPQPDKPAADMALSRRSFMKWLGGGALLHTLVFPACRQSNEYLVPYNSIPEWTVPGLSTRYATCMPWHLGAIPAVAVCREGSPVNLEPAPWMAESPGLPPHVLASLWGLYDPSRSSQKLFHGQEASDDEFKGAFAAWARKTAGKGKVGFVFSGNDSPLRRQMLEEISRINPDCRFFSWETFSSRNRHAATQSALGEGVISIPRFNRAARIFAIDCDFLAADFQGYTGDYYRSRLPEGDSYKNLSGDYGSISRLYAVEARLSISGGMADERLTVRPSLLPAVIWELARLTGRSINNTALVSLEKMDAFTPYERKWIETCASDLILHRGRSLVLLGSQYPEEWHRLVLEINMALDAAGTTLSFVQKEPELLEPAANLPDALENGGIDTLFICCHSDILAHAPAEWNLEGHLARPDITSIRLALYTDQTGAACTWFLPMAHYLESWGLERDAIGRYCYQQPVINPLHNGISEAELLNGLLHSRGILSTGSDDSRIPSPVYQRIRRCFDRISSGADREAGWADALRAGYSSQTAYPTFIGRPVPLDGTTLETCRKQIHLPTERQQGIEIQLVPDYSTYDGRFSHNAWLHECPDPVTGTCWEIPAQATAATWRQLAGNGKGKATRMFANLSDEGVHEFAATEVPAMAEGVVVLPAGKIDGTDEADPVSGPLPIKASYGKTFLVLPPGSLSIACGGAMPPSPTRVAKDRLPVPLLNAGRPPMAKANDLPEPPSGGDRLHQWGMAIDLSVCTGCNACLIACQAENNIPIVGKKEILNGRAMHWIRLDRYFTQAGGGQRPGTHFLPQPVACQQCEAAPCESVCPVNATTHTSDGLNAMVYPRCWGTRYCAANCPYKARRFNFFDYAKASDRHSRYQRNPHVTVRSRGVMEKCTYCVQRIEDARVRHKAWIMEQNRFDENGAIKPLDAESLRLPPNTIQTACQAACPANAISFGNLLQKEQRERVVDAKRSPRNIELLGKLGTRPRTSYLSRVINSNPELD